MNTKKTGERPIPWKPRIFLPLDVLVTDTDVPLAAYVLNYTDLVIKNLKKNK